MYTNRSNAWLISNSCSWQWAVEFKRSKKKKTNQLINTQFYFKEREEKKRVKLFSVFD